MWKGKWARGVKEIKKVSSDVGISQKGKKTKAQMESPRFSGKMGGR